jgi:hypothetical protein
VISRDRIEARAKVVAKRLVALVAHPPTYLSNPEIWDQIPGLNR